MFYKEPSLRFSPYLKKIMVRFVGKVQVRKTYGKYLTYFISVPKSVREFYSIGKGNLLEVEVKSVNGKNIED